MLKLIWRLTPYIIATVVILFLAFVIMSFVKSCSPGEKIKRIGDTLELVKTPGEPEPAFDKLEPVEIKEDHVTLGEKLNPFYKFTDTEKLTAGLPEGTEVYEITTGEGTGHIIRLPSGDIYTPEGQDVFGITVHRKTSGNAGFELKPIVAGTAGYKGVGGGVVLGLARIHKLHLGPAFTVTNDFNKTDYSAGVAGTYNIGGNVHIGATVNKVLNVDKRDWYAGGIIGLAVR